MDALMALGFDPFFQKQITTENPVVARIAAEHRGGYNIWSSAGTGFARLAGRIARELEGEALPGVGDWVTLKSKPVPDQISIIEKVLNRRTAFIRGAAGGQTRGQVVAANIDTVLIVCGLDNDYNLRRIERYLARVWASGAQPVVVLNKTDLCDQVDERMEEVRTVSIGVDVIGVSAIRLEGLEKMQSFILPTKTAALVGSSGAGKSTLVNALVGEERMTTREIRNGDDRGRHTTTHRQLIVLPQGGLLMDTPGMRELQLFDEEGIGTVFSDLEALSAHCRYRDCSHVREPGCAVIEAVAQGEIAEERYDHYLKLHKEAQSYELRQNEHKRRKAGRIWGQLSEEAKRIRRWKGDD